MLNLKNSILPFLKRFNSRTIPLPADRWHRRTRVDDSPRSDLRRRFSSGRADNLLITDTTKKNH